MLCQKFKDFLKFLKSQNCLVYLVFCCAYFYAWYKHDNTCIHTAEIMLTYNLPQVIEWTGSPCRPPRTAMPLWTNRYQRFPPLPRRCGLRQGRRPPAAPWPSRSTNPSPPPLCWWCWCIQPSRCLMVRCNTRLWWYMTIEKNKLALMMIHIIISFARLRFGK